MMTHFSVLYLDMDLPIYKIASDVPKDHRYVLVILLTIPLHGYHPNTLYHLNLLVSLPLVTILVDSLNPPLSVLQSTKSF
jgi:hypothetical protein